MTDPVVSVDLTPVLTRIAEAIESLAFQQETSNMLIYNGQPMTAVKQQIGKRLGVGPDVAAQAAAATATGEVTG